MFDPWQVFAALPGWQLLWQPVPTRAQICWSRRTILLDPRLPVPAQRVALTHELVHVARGPYLLRVRRREEAAVRRETALLLVDIVHLADAAAWSRCAVVIADQLDVDADTVTARAEALTLDDRAWIDARLEYVHFP